jgi:hypothetical protein
MHPVLCSVFDSYAAALSAQPADWCQLHPRQDDRFWSAQELIEHLVLTLRSSSGALEKRLERGRPTAARCTPVQWMVKTAVLSSGRMPRGVSAPVFARPDQLHWTPMNGAELVQLLRQEIDRMDALLDTCRQRFGLQRIASHFLLGPLRADQWRRFHTIHIRHHLGQLRRIESSIGQAAAPSNRNQPATR